MIVATVLLLSTALVSYGKTGDRNAKLVKSLTTALQNSQAREVQITSEFKRTSFLFNDKTVNAYFDVESNDLVGFSLPASVSDLPAGVMETIGERYSNYQFLEAILFIHNSGNYSWFISMSRPKKPTIVLSINTQGKVRYYSKM